MHWDHQRTLHGFHKTILDESGREQSEDFRSDYRAWFHSVAPNLDPDATAVGWNSYRAAPYYLPEELHPTRWTGDVAVRFLEQYQQSNPWFLKVSFARPHSPYDPPQRWMDAYAEADLPRAAIGDWAGRYRRESRPGDPTIWHGDVGSAQVRYARQGYYGSVSFIDEQVGRIVEALDRRGWLENTLIIYTSDHGDMTGDHHMWRKSYAYEASARVPMIMRWPQGLVSADRGQVRHEPVEIRDILATCCDAAETETPEPIDGRSMLDPVRGKTADWRSWIDLEHDVCYSKRNHWTALTDGRWKYVFHALDGEEQLFHLGQDPHEQRDLAGIPAHTDALKTWRSRMVAHLAPRGEGWVENGRPALRPEAMRYSPNYPKDV
jgi:arylsulfatase A-like enzyme